MDELEWATVIVRFIPFLVWSFVIAIAPRGLAGSPDRYRRLLTLRLVWGATLVMLFGALGAGGLIPRDWGVTAYTAFASIVGIVGITFLWTYGGRR